MKALRYLLTVFTLALPVNGQIVTPANQTGLPIFGSVNGSDFDQVSLMNGNLHVSIPILTVPQRKDSLTYTFVYNTPTWVLTNFRTPPQLSSVSEGFDGSTGWQLTSNYEGWQVNYSQDVIECGPEYDPFGNFTGYAIAHNIFYGFFISDPQGTKHPVGIRWEDGDPSHACQGSVVKGFTLDGSGILVDISGWSQDAPAETTTRLTLKDGTVVVWDSRQDPNGNLSGGGVDQLGRSPLTVSSAGIAVYTSPDNQTVHGPAYTLWTVYDSNGNAQTIRLDYTAIDIHTTECSDQFAYSNCDEDQEVRLLPYTLTLQSSQLKYKFTWQENGFADLQRIDLPTGGYITYEYGTQTCCSTQDASGYVQTFPVQRVVTSRTVVDQSGSRRWTYNINTGKVTDPLGQYEIHQFSYLPVGPQISGTPYETQVQSFDATGKLLRTTAKDYAQEAGPIGSGFASTEPVVNVRAIRETTTLGTVVTKKEIDYETVQSPDGMYTATFLNPTEIREYDFASGNQWPLLRITDYVYQHQVDSTYLTAHIVDKVHSEHISDGGGHWAAQTDYQYDQYFGGIISTNNSVPPQLHDYAHFGPANTVRGNLTQVTKYVTQGTTLAPTVYNYDDLGNLRSVKDPGGHTTTYVYNDAFTASCPGMPSNTFGYASTETNALGHQSNTFRYACTGLVSGQQDQNDINAGRPGTTQTYDLMNRPLTTNYPDGGQTTISYNGDPIPPHITKTVLATPNPTIVTDEFYDGLGRLASTQLTSDPEGIDITYTTYDGLGRTYQVYNPTRCNPPTTNCGEPTWGYTTYQYDALGRTTLVTKQDGNTAQTDYSAFPTVKVTDETGRQRQSITDALGRLTEVIEPRVAGDPVVNYDVMQSDGNLVVYAQGGVPEWSSGTWQTSSGGSYVLDMQNDGNLVLYKTSSLWGSNAVQSAQSPAYATPGCTNIGSALSQGQSLATGSCLVSPAGRYELVMQGDGNLVLYDLSRSPILALWSSTTAGTGANYVVMQTDGNFVLYQTGGVSVWSTGTTQSSPQGSFSIVMQDDGNLVVYNTYSLWDSNTVQSGGSAGPYPTPSCSNIGWQLAEGQTLTMNSCLVSTSGRYELVLQSDGNLVLYDLSTGVALWNSGTQEFTPFTYPYITRYSYDALGNLLCVEQHGDQGGTGCSSAPTNDASSGWRVRRFTYDSLSRLLSSSNPESGTASYSYAVDTNCNPGGEELLSATDARGVAKNNCYDALHRLTSVTYSDATPPISIAYDTSPWGLPVKNAIGRMTQSMSSSVAQILSYDSMGRVVTQWNCVPSNCNSTIGTYATSALYDLASNLTHLTYPDGRIVDYQIDAAGRTYNVASSGNTFLNVSSFWPGGQWQNATYGNGASTADTYNKRLQPSELKLMNGGNTPVVDLNYSWSGCDGSTGNNGNLCGISDAVNSNHNQTYSYDLLNRLSTASEADGAFNQTFSYDPWGNMSYSGGTGGSTSYSLQNRVAVYCHDQSGNILDYGACPATGPHQFAWNGAGRLSAVTAPNPASYTYDGDGNRVRKDAGSSWTEYVHFNGEPVAENSATGWTDYVFAGGKRIAEISAGNTQYYWADHLQSARVMLDSSGNAQCYDTYTPFGSEVGTCAMTHYKFTGKERDGETSLDYFGARYYSSTVGRFLSPDRQNEGAQALDPQSWNAYSYVGNNPLNRTDPNGDDYHVCNNNGNCKDLSDAEYDQWRKTQGDNITVTGSGKIIDSWLDKQIGTVSWFDGDAQRRADASIALLGFFVVNQALEATGAATEALIGKIISDVPQVRINNFKGVTVGENIAQAMLRLKGYKILGRHVSVRTSKGIRIVDFIVEKGGERIAIEVKTGEGFRNAAQLAKDAAMESEGGTLVGDNAREGLRGQTLKLKTIEVRPF